MARHRDDWDFLSPEPTSLGAGKRVGTAQCREQIAAQNQILHIQTIQKQGEINAETLRRGTDDIRRVLRTQYTIAE